MTTFTDLEIAVLKKLFPSSDGNGHDFGFIEDARRAVPQRSQLAGVVASLVKKGVIIVFDPHTTDSGTFTQFKFTALDDSRREKNMTREEFLAAEAALAAQIGVKARVRS